MQHQEGKKQKNNSNGSDRVNFLEGTALAQIMDSNVENSEVGVWGRQG